MNVRGLILILVNVFLFYKASNFFMLRDKSVYILFGVVAGWGIEYFIDVVMKAYKEKKSVKSEKTGRGKILDSSAIIDGRILDILETGFVEGEIIIPNFVLEELQYLADSEDNMKRARGRRGLDLIKSIQANKSNKVVVEDKDYKIKEVDAKLVKLGKELNGDVVTTDYNLNKVATIQGVKVLNINKLSNALKPVVIPNEELEIELIKKGDRDGQAVGYLHDGTMVVAEDGGPFLGRTITLVVTSVYPTAAGRMIFGKIKRR
ncbi:PIN/TRAM domain-containing protein [Haliovirga abyssi]|uniref:PIN domain-containing protein n=1 Tax=Haliovirga abyssi TaxID=2996794 RepID=A0AAU9D985_9FUSO|nr:PIN domain-containing protein [Haliovirga abyssi]BDU51183.1 hypothetical protein HLVA_17520 [Haliovirga abyssi]